MRIPIDMTGKKEKNWIVLERANAPTKNTSKSVYWLCQCEDCGKQKVFCGVQIRQHKIGRCKCKDKNRDLQKSQLEKHAKIGQIKDEVGHTYGKLKIESLAYTANGLAYWNCLCSCGNKVIVRGNHLRTGATKSCGCLISYKELCIANLLKENLIEYLQQYTFDDLFDKQKLRFDFALFNKGELVGLIEYNGKQHYEEPNKFNKYGKLQIHDEMKIKYCKEKNIPLLILDKENNIEEILNWYQELIQEN